jgi:hypothetical protein
LGHQKEKKAQGFIKHIEKQLQRNFVPGKNIVINSSSASHKGLYLVSSIQRAVVQLNLKACY